MKRFLRMAASAAFLLLLSACARHKIIPDDTLAQIFHDAFLTNAYIDYPDVDSAQLTTVAFKVAYGKFGGWFMAIAIAIFAWTTIIGMYYSCEKSVNYAFGDTKANRRATWVYMVYYMLPCVLFYNIEADTLWAMTDLLSAIYVIITLLFIYSKQREIFRLFHDFWDRFVPAQERGENPEPVVYGTVDEKAKGEF